MNMHFDTIIGRRGTGSLKWDNVRNDAGKPDIIPLWVADMDFSPPEAVLSALRMRVEHPIFGYTNAPTEYLEALASWYRGRYNAAVGREAILLGPGLIPTLGISIRALTAAGDGVLLMPPVYHPFFDIVEDNGRVVVEAPLRLVEGRSYELDLAAAGDAIDEAAARGVRTTAILFSSPHNPGGRVWSPEELAALVAFAAERDLRIVSDEIHGDLVAGPRKFTSLAAFPRAAERTVVLSAPNKTFNLAGLHLSHFVVENDSLRSTIVHGIAAAGYSQPNVLSVTAALAAYREGGPWVDSLIAYLAENLVFAVDFVNTRIPGASAVVPEGTYLVWAEVSPLISSLGIRDDKEFALRLEDEGRVKITAGSVFGNGGSGFIRINVACPRALLSEGLERFASWASSARR
jgi:cystathionine beta-lyase